MKINSVVEAAQTIRRLKRLGKIVGLCHGGFDLLHPGHIQHFAAARHHCDFLVVSITSDRFVRERKGPGRPIFRADERAFMIAAIRWVDLVVITDAKCASLTIRALKPNVYIKGPDYVGKRTPGILDEKAAIEEVGGTFITTRDPTYSTTKLIENIRRSART